MADQTYQCDTLIVGAGIAGIATALELLNLGQRVLLLDAAGRGQCGGQANDAFGGMLLCGTKEQARSGIKDSPELMLHDWHQAASFADNDVWGKRWAKVYSERNQQDVYQWLRELGIQFMPAVQWVERGNYGDGNSLPRYHIAWGCGRGVVQTLAQKVFGHEGTDKFRALFDHRVTRLQLADGKVTGVEGTSPQGEFGVTAHQVVLTSGGINGSLQKVRDNWDAIYGPCPDNLLTGTDPRADGALHDEVVRIGGQVLNLGQMWNYAAGIAEPNPRYQAHGLSLIPSRSALWVDSTGKRVGPEPMVTGFDTHDLCKKVGHMPGQYGWQVMNWNIAAKELAVSGTDTNPVVRDKQLVKMVVQTLKGNHKLVQELVDNYPDVLMASTLDELISKMKQLTADSLLNAEQLQDEIKRYDAAIERGPGFHNDPQLQRISHLRQWKIDKLRTCKFQKIIDDKAGALIAIRTRIIARKSMGGMVTDLQSRVIGGNGQPIVGLYAAGEATGFGGGGISGIRSLEGTFLSNCILTGRRAAQAIAGKLTD